MPQPQPICRCGDLGHHGPVEKHRIHDRVGLVVHSQVMASRSRGRRLLDCLPERVNPAALGIPEIQPNSNLARHHIVGAWEYPRVG